LLKDASNLFLIDATDDILEGIVSFGDDKTGLSGPGERNIEGEDWGQDNYEADQQYMHKNIIIKSD